MSGARLRRSWLLAAGLALALVAVVLGVQLLAGNEARTASDAAVRQAKQPGTAPSPAAEPAPVPAPPAGAADVAPSEEALMARLRDEVDGSPAAALDLARQGERLYPGGSHADERSFLKMRALVNLADISGAREEAYLFYERHPDSPYVRRVQRLTGLHPTPVRPPRR